MQGYPQTTVAKALEAALDWERGAALITAHALLEGWGDLEPPPFTDAQVDAVLERVRGRLS